MPALAKEQKPLLRIQAALKYYYRQHRNVGLFTGQLRALLQHYPSG